MSYRELYASYIEQLAVLVDDSEHCHENADYTKTLVQITESPVYQSGWPVV